MILNLKHFVVFVTILFLTSCKQKPQKLSRIEGKQIAIDSTLLQVDSIDSFVNPYRDRINQVLDSTLAYAPKVLTKEDGAYNTSAGNLMADIILSEGNTVFKKRTGKDIDFVLVNHGGIRAIISKGNVSARTAYQVMPFENNIAVVELSGASVLNLANFLIKSNRAHPIAGMQIIIDKDDSLKTLKIQGRPLDKKRKYYVATSDYLVSGGDDMVFFKDALSITDTDYLIRNAMIDYFKKTDTLRAQVDDRFIKLN
jgi:2',3'-cyclic-nucleotide 2'-phosphodiesterase (5'-nucleotidase family)